MNDKPLVRPVMDADEVAIIERIIKECYREHLDCDGQSRLFSWKLQQAGIQHTVCVGSVELIIGLECRFFPLHYWIDFYNNGYVLDCKLRKWFGDEAPHGMFAPGEHEVTYRFDQVDKLQMSEFLCSVLMRDVTELMDVS